MTKHYKLKTRIALAIACCMMGFGASAQVSTYAFSQASGTYTPITGGTVLDVQSAASSGAGSLDDINYTVALPFSFTYNGVAYNSCNVNTNGSIGFGTGTFVATNYSVISSTDAVAGYIAGINMDLNGGFSTTATRTSGSNTLTSVNNTSGVVVGSTITFSGTGVPAGTTVTAVTANTITMSANSTTSGTTGTYTIWTGKLQTGVSGTVGSRVFTVEWDGFRPRSVANTRANFQIQLFEGSNLIEVVFGGCRGASGTTVQSGLRGATNTDFIDRATTTDWSATTAGGTNAATLSYTATVVPASGLTYIWTPSTPCSGTPTAGTITGASAVCSGTGTTLSLTGVPVLSGITYQWASSTTAGGPYTTTLGTTTTQATGNLTAPKYYVLTLTCTASGLSATTPEFAVGINALPTVGVTPASSTICQPGGTAVALTASGATTYAWGPSAGLSATTGTTVNATPTATTTYTVTGTDGNGCVATSTAAVNVSASIVGLTATATPSSVCSGGNSQLGATATTTPNYTLTSITPAIITPSGATNITTWTNGSDDGSSPAIAMPFSFNYYGNTYNQLYVGTNGYISFDDLSAVGGAALRTAQNFPSTSTPNNVIALCMADLNQVAGTTSTFVSGVAPNRVFVIAFTGVPFYSSTGGVSGQIQLYETSNIVEVHVTSIDHGTSTSNNSLGIENSGGTLGSTPAGRGTASTWNVSTPEAYRWTPGAYNYVWSPSTFLDNPAIINPMASAITASTTYTVTASYGGCSASSSVAITAGAALTSAATVSSDTICTGTSITFGATAIGGGGPYTYAWSGPNSFNSTSQNPVLASPVVASSGTYVVTITDNCSATSSASVTVLVNALPAVAVTPTTGTFCSGGTAVALSASGANTYAWGPSAGLSATTGSSVGASPTAATTYTVTGTDGNGCVNTATATIQSVATPAGVTATATPASICSGGSSQLLAAATTTPNYILTSITPALITPAGATAITTWTNGSDDGSSPAIAMPFSFNYYGNNYSQLYVGTNGYISFNDLSAQSGLSLRAAQNFPSTATPNNVIALCMADLNQVSGSTSTFVSGIAPNRVFVIAFDSVPFYSASGSVSGQIQLYETSNIVEVHVKKVDHGGSSGSTSLNSLGIENAGGTLGSTPSGRGNAAIWDVTTPEAYRWTPGTYDYTWTPSTFLNNAAIINPMATGVTATTTYTVSVSNNGCAATATATLTAGSALTSAATLSSDTVCVGTTVTFGAVPTGGGAPYTYAWSGPNSFSSTTQNPTLVTTLAAAGTYTIIVTDNCAATSSATVTLTVNGLPTISVTPATALYCNPGAAISVVASGSSTSYSWAPAAGLSSTTTPGLGATPTATTTYTVTGTDGNGCMNTATTTITSAQAVTGVTATSTPSAVCAGSATALGVTSGLFTATILSENFNSGAPSWTRVNNSTGGTPANAAWTDRSDGFVYGTGAAYHSNDNSTFVQSNSDSQGLGSVMNTALVSPVINTTGYTGIKLNFYHYYRDIADNGDSAVVEASLNGTNWGIIGSYTTTQGSENAFSAASITLPATYDNQAAVYVRFRYIATWDWYWSIDNVSVTGGSSAFTYGWTSSPAGFTSSAQNPTGVTPAATTDYTVTVTNPGGCSATGTTTVTVNPLPTVTAAASAASVCAGGSETLTGGGATTYTWDNSVVDGATFIPAATTTYVVTGTDGNGCMNTASTTVTVNALPTVTATPSAAAVCAGGSETLTGGGATSYTWDNSVTDGVSFVPAATTTYQVTGTDVNGCINTATTTVTVNTLPTVTATPSAAAVCAGGSETLTGGGATTYTWDNSVTDGTSFVPAATTTYQVTGTDGNGCMNTATTTVTVNPLPTVTANASTPQVCAGTDVTLTGGGANTYTWDNSVSDGVAFAPTSTTTYQVTGTDGNGCMNTATTTVMVNPLPTVDMTAFSATPLCTIGSPVSLTNGSPAGGTYSGTGVSAGMFDPSVGPGMFVINYSYTDANGCANTDTASVTVDICEGIANNTAEGIQDINVYPNPTSSGMVNITINNANFSQLLISIMDVQGKQVYNELDKNISAAYSKQINVEGFAKGIYYIRLTSGTDSKVQKLVIQ